ncbi:uncharacterized protein LOC126780647 [Nymphalis io]|uniref:uncharacterized protein LOC126780647 n=1 Tax=Inachis io TaxID=171585 RepID=UPI00216861E3|nr:uncharacterized protein LOC126780647 [Nymphalis io]
MMVDNKSLDLKDQNYCEIMSEDENNQKVSLENIREVELSIIYVRKKMLKIIGDFNTTPNIHFKQRKKLYKYNKFKVFRCTKQQIKSYTNKDACIHYKSSCRNYKKMNSMPILNNLQNEHSTSSSAKSWNNFLSSNPRNFNSNFIVNTLITSQYQNSEGPCLNNYLFIRPCWKVYRCQLNTKEETCCCSCNSDAMFEVMKSLYDCYKKKNCDNCNCILCGHLPREERRLGELRKKGELSLGAISEFMQQGYIKKLPPEKVEKLNAEGLLTPLKGKNLDKKEEILRGLAMNGIPLPKGKTASDIKLIDKIRRDIGLPPEPKSPSAKKKYEKAVASGLITPLFGKSPSEKERILKGQADLGLALPIGQTTSEKKLIAKLKGLKAPSSKLLRDKTPAEKEKVIKDLAMKGMLPEGKTSSEKDLIEKVRTEVGLLPAPKTSLDRKKYEKAIASDLTKPLVGKTASEKEKKLREQAKIFLPEGRTPSEKTLIPKVKEEYTPDRIKRAKTGKITPLAGKTPEQKESILRELIMHKIPLPEDKTPSEIQIFKKVRKDLGLPPEPKLKHEKAKYNEGITAGLITPLEGKTQSQKEKILQAQADMGIQLSEGRTASEKSLIKRIKKKSLPPEKRKKLDEKTLKVLKEGKGPSDECICGVIASELAYATPSQKEKKIRELAMQGPLPEAKTASEKKLYEKVQADLKLPSVPTTPSLKEKYPRAQDAGVIMPLEGKTKSQKAKILVKQAEMGIPLSEGRTPSEKALVNKVRATVKPITGKTPEEQKKILRNIVKAGLPLPEGTTPSEKQIIKHVKNDLGIPTVIPSEQFLKAKAAPLEGKTKAQKEKKLRDRIATGLPLPEGVTPSDKELIKQVKESTGYKTPKYPSKIIKKKSVGLLTPLEGKKTSEKTIIDKMKEEVKFTPEKKPLSAKLRGAKAGGLLTPLDGKTAAQKEKILRGLAKAGIPLPEGKTKSEKNIIEKVREDVGLPPEPKALSLKEKIKQAQIDGIVTPLEGKTPAEKEKILIKMHDAGIPLPKGRTASEKSLVKKIKARPRRVKEALSEKLRKAKTASFLTPLEGKTTEQKERILRGLAKTGVPLPEGKTSSEKKIIEKVREEVGLPPEPKTPLLREKMKQAQIDGFIMPLEGKTPAEKEKILLKMHEAGIPLPKGRTASEKSLVKKVKAGVITRPYRVSSKKLREAKALGLLTPLEGKTSAQKERIITGLAKAGLPLPEGKTASEKALINKVHEKIKKIDKKSAKTLKEGKGPSDECICDMLTPMTPSKKTISMTTLIGKTPEEKERYLKDIALQGIPLPEAKTKSDKKLINKIRADIALPPEPTTPSLKKKYYKALDAGLITPLQGKSVGQKEKILRKQAGMGLPLPEGRTPSEKELIAKVRATTPPLSKVHIPLKSEKMHKAKAAGILTPLQGKSPEQKEKILKGLAMHGMPLPEPTTSSERNIIDRVRAEGGLPPEPKTRQERQKTTRAIADGIKTPLQEKSQSQKEKILREQAELGLHLPEGRTPSEKELKAKVRATTPPVIKVKSEKLRKAKAAGLLTPLEGKSPEQKEKYLKGLAMHGIPLPEPKSSSERNIMNKVRAEVGLPPEPKTRREKEKYNRAVAAGIITPLQGKAPSQKEKIIRGQAKLGLPLPEGRTPSEKSLIRKVKETTPVEPELPTMPPEELAKLDKKTAKNMKDGKGPSDECICHILSPHRSSLSKKSTKIFKIPSEKLRKVKEAGLVTPLEGKSTAQKEKIIKGLALQGIPLPKPKTDSERKLIDKVRTDLGLPPEPKTISAKKIYNKALADGFITPMQGKSHAQKEKILRKQAELGLLLPVGRTPSEKSLIAKIEKTSRPPSEKLSKARAAGLLTPLEGKTFEQKEKKLKNLAEAGLPIPEGKTPSERSLIRKVETEYGKLAKAKTKSKKVGEAVARKKGGITQEFEDIIKTTTCDRGCGCDKKKIRFKHSYVKIRVTSPDISSLCPCPEECVPGVKGGVFTDNEGIKVTVGRVTGVPSFSSRKSFDGDHIYFESNNTTLLKYIYIGDDNSVHTYPYPKSYKNTNITCSKSETEINVQKRCTKQCYRRNYKTCSSYNSIDILRNVCKNSISAEIIQSLEKNFKNFNSSQECFITNTSNNTSFESMYLLNKYSSVSLLTLPTSISIISFSTTVSSSNSTFYKDKISYTSLNLSECLQSMNDFNTSDARDNSFECNDCYSNTCYLMETNYLDKKESAIIHKSNSLNVHDFICDILSKRPINNTSSLVIVMSTTSDEHTSKYSLDDRGQLSTIAIDLLENHNNWNYKANSLHHFHEKHRGFKITSKGKICENNNTSTMLAESNKRNMQNKKEIYERNLLINEFDEQNHQTFTRNQNHFRIISTDTTQDRPCCCKSKEGLSHEKHKYSQENNRIRQPRLTSTHSNLGMPTPIRFCKIPPCNDLTKNIYPSIPNCVSKKTPSNNATSDTIFKTCDCSPDKLMKLFEKSKKDVLSKTCNNRSDEMIDEKKQIPNEYHGPECNKCRSNKLREAGYGKKVKNLCPCEQHKNFIDHSSNDIADKINDQKGTSSKYRCKCKEQKHFTKNIICECPEPEPEIDFIDWIDEKHDRKLKSDLTQTISGFKINIPRKKTDWENWELEMNFEETLRYIAENLENESKQYNSDICSCKSDLKLQSENVSIDCECPQDAYTPEAQEEKIFEEPFTGIKFHISGKGSGSKGLNGILCF